MMKSELKLIRRIYCYIVNIRWTERAGHAKQEIHIIKNTCVRYLFCVMD